MLRSLELRPLYSQALRALLFPLSFSLSMSSPSGKEYRLYLVYRRAKAFYCTLNLELAANSDEKVYGLSILYTNLLVFAAAIAQGILSTRQRNPGPSRKGPPTSDTAVRRI